MMTLYDQKLSLRFHLYRLFQDRIASGEMQILMQRAKDFHRPSWRIQRLNHRAVDYGPLIYFDECQWQLTYYPVNEADGENVMDQLKLSLEQGGENYNLNKLILGYKFNWQFPQPWVEPRVVSEVPGLPGGTYQVRVSGIDACGDESAASVALPVTVAASHTVIAVRVPLVPSLLSNFSKYCIYVDGHKEEEVVQPHNVNKGTSDNYVYATTEIGSLQGNGAAPTEPNWDSPTRWRYMRVIRYNSDMREDNIVAGAFIGGVTMETSVQQSRQQPQPDVMRHFTPTIYDYLELVV